MLYIVTWLLVSVYQVPCEFNKPHYDEYGRYVNQFVVYSVLCTDTKKEEHKKEFKCREDAERFINSCPKKTSFYTLGDYIENIKLDSVDIWMEEAN